jgi:hypothetical protein
MASQFNAILVVNSLTWRLRHMVENGKLGGPGKPANKEQHR